MAGVGGERLLALLHLCDSLFPIGGFAHSDGLEAAAFGGMTVEALREWMDVCLTETVGRLEGPALLLAWSAFRRDDWEGLARVDQDITALRPSSASRRASRAMGLRLLTTWQALHAEAPLAGALALARAGAIGPALPTAFACACAASDIDARSSAHAFAYTRLAAAISAAMRVMPIGQSDAHGLLAAALSRVPAEVDAMLARDAAPQSFAPATDIAAMSQQYMHSRLFRS
jgi:urease accessory protein